MNGYLPYTKVVYKPEEVSQNVRRINLYRARQKAVAGLRDDPSENTLWKAVVAFQQYPFFTASGLPFSYEIKRGQYGRLNRELIVNRRKENKTLAWSSVMLAFQNALEKQGTIIERPKALGDIRGISYIYPMLFRFGIIEVPEGVAGKMRVKGGVGSRLSRPLIPDSFCRIIPQEKKSGCLIAKHKSGA